MSDKTTQGRTKRDKIFDNTFEETEYEFDTSMSFALAAPKIIIKFACKLIADEIHALITNSRFKKFNKIDDPTRC